MLPLPPPPPLHAPPPNLRRCPTSLKSPLARASVYCKEDAHDDAASSGIEVESPAATQSPIHWRLPIRPFISIRRQRGPQPSPAEHIPDSAPPVEFLRLPPSRLFLQALRLLRPGASLQMDGRNICLLQFSDTTLCAMTDV